MGQKLAAKRTSKIVIFKKELPFYVMLIPGVIFTLLFSYLPMFGLTMAFQNFTPLRSFSGSPWVGLKNFRDMLALPTFWDVVGNTLSISLCKIVLRLLVPLILALLLNEVIHPRFMRVSQTVLAYYAAGRPPHCCHASGALLGFRPERRYGAGYAAVQPHGL